MSTHADQSEGYHNLLHELARQKECENYRGSFGGHVRMRILSTTKYAVSEMLGYPKGKSAIEAAVSSEKNSESHRHYFIIYYSHCGIGFAKISCRPFGGRSGDQYKRVHP